MQGQALTWGWGGGSGITDGSHRRRQVAGCARQAQSHAFVATTPSPALPCLYQIMNVPLTPPAGRYYYYHNSGLQQQYVIYSQAEATLQAEAKLCERGWAEAGLRRG